MLPFRSAIGSTNSGGRMPQPTRTPGENDLENVSATITVSPLGS